MSEAPSETDELPENPTDAPKPPESAIDSDRYGHLTLDSSAVVIYDREEPDTWLQSDFVVDVGA
ncbi:MAG: hypothetical protein ACI8UR_002403 [Natronomonas sp.]|jgi:hypothetical protein|uniref:hypothetical protein n=1 Tax=Natronomonas sp. TaxID=2184060 RepID=UPI003988BC3E